VGTRLVILWESTTLNPSEWRVMRKLIAALIAALLVSSSVVFAADRPLLTVAAREATLVAPARSVFRQTAAGQSTPETKPWIERHPVWFGLIAGASVGATWGALKCRRGCFIGTGGAAMVSSWWGAGAGALIGWGVGRAQ
jgi:hypothetical protein